MISAEGRDGFRKFHQRCLCLNHFICLDHGPSPACGWPLVLYNTKQVKMPTGASLSPSTLSPKHAPTPLLPSSLPPPPLRERPPRSLLLLRTLFSSSTSTCPCHLSSFSSVEYACGHRLLARGQMFLERWDVFQNLRSAVGSERALEHGFCSLSIHLYLALRCESLLDVRAIEKEGGLE